ncbi:unnamed protein product [Caenorhabditis brenneri]
MAAQKTNHNEKISAFLQKGYAYNNYPNITHSHSSRHNLDIVEDGQGKAQGTLRNEEVCMVCRGEASEENELFTCDGKINGEMKNGKVMALKKRPSCNSKFHLDCIKAYNANAFDFAYAARPECQRKFLCPLHCCSVCNTEHMKQSAYESELIECAYCFRAFHSKCCYPAGSKKLDVIIESSTFKMLVCPSHSAPAPVLQHLPACCAPECKIDGELQECKKCIRSFHPECRKVKKINEELTEKDAPEDLCDSCLCQDVIIVKMRAVALCLETDNIDMPVIALCPTTNKFRMGEVLAAKELGAMKIQWLKNGLPDGNSLVPNSHVAEVREGYLHLAEGNQKSYWETTFDDYKDEHLKRYPTVFKKVFMPVKKSRYAEGNRKTMPSKIFPNSCECGQHANCEENCNNAIHDHECPPSCSRDKADGFVCNNQKISTGFVNPKIRLEKAGKKGYGIFATGRIEKGEFLAGFHGEICDEDEFERRRAVKVNSRDLQASEQFMKLSNGFTMDMDRYGSIARYVNHSCKNFNAVFLLKRAFVRKNKRKEDIYEYRRYLKASRVIEAGEEVTVSYGFTNKSCFCDSCLKEKKELEKLEWIEDLDKENVEPSGATKRKATSETNSPKAKVFKPSN